MRSIPIPELVQEANEILDGCRNRWKNNRGEIERFSFQISGKSVKIQIVKGPISTGSQIHVVELFPLEKKAFFYNHGGHYKEREMIEKNLSKRGYTTEEKELEWFNLDYQGKGMIT